RMGQREYDVRHRRSAEIVARAGYTLGIIERVVLPSDAALARKLLSELLDAEQQIADQAYEDDYGAEELFARVRGPCSARAPSADGSVQTQCSEVLVKPRWHAFSRSPSLRYMPLNQLLATRRIACTRAAASTPCVS
ncbi:MAG: hypothetical protein WB823_14320, partial [Steroidobacteraceae bacterium]